MNVLILDRGVVRALDNFDEIRPEPGQVVWIQLGADDAPTKALLERFAIHPLTVEDIWEQRNSPKIEEYRDYIYVLIHGLRREPKARRIDDPALDLVIGKDWLITHDPGDLVTSDLTSACQRTPRLFEKGTAWLAHAMLDHLVDGMAPILDDFDAEIERLQSEVLDKAGTSEGGAVLARLLGFRRELQDLRRTSIHQREILLRLSRSGFTQLIPDDVLPFMRDVYDHFVRASDLADSYRDLVSSALDAYLSVQSNRMNEVMKTLTLISTVFLPLTLMAGVWGMNFKHMPELDEPWGYTAALAAMASVALAIVVWFWRRGWLKRQS